jgi:hypothetical protein
MALLRAFAPGRSVVDVGCMWAVAGAYCFAAEDAGASAVTGVDLMPVSERFEAEQARRGSAVVDEVRTEPFLAIAMARPA